MIVKTGCGTDGSICGTMVATILHNNAIIPRILIIDGQLDRETDWQLQLFPHPTPY